MSIKKGATNINKIYRGNTPISKVFIGETRVFPDVINKFIENCKPLGGNADEIRALYNNIDSVIRSQADVLLFPSVVDQGVVYGMDNITGELVPFEFSRSSQATVFSSQMDMQVVDANVPRIDYGNYSDDAKILIEKESTNYLLNSSNQSFEFRNNNSTTQFAEITSDSNGWYVRKNTGAVGDNISIYSGILYGDSRSVDSSFDPTKYFTTSIWMNPEVEMGIYFARYTRYDYFTLKANRFNKAYYTVLNTDTTYQVRLTEFYAIPTIKDKKIYYNYYNVEHGDVSTSYIPTTNAQATRSADALQINLLKDSEVYIKTTKEEKYLDKTAGVWNVQDDIAESDGIICLAIIYR